MTSCGNDFPDQTSVLFVPLWFTLSGFLHHRGTKSTEAEPGLRMQTFCGGHCSTFFCGPCDPVRPFFGWTVRSSEVEFEAETEAD